jgi:hypothetical protein
MSTVQLTPQIEIGYNHIEQLPGVDAVNDTGTGMEETFETAVANIGVYQDVADLDAALAGAPHNLDATVIAQMTLNDKVYQLRTLQDPTSIFVRNDNALV